jgi:hypothetical protein
LKLFLTVVLLLALVGPPAWIVHQNRDLPEIADADLRVGRFALADRDNAYTHLQSASADLEWPDGLEASPALLDKNRFALKYIVRTLGAPKMQVPEYLVPGDESADVSRWTEIGELLALRARLRMSYGRQRLALADGLATVRLGKRIEGARGGLVFHAKAGIEIKRVGMEALDSIVSQTVLTPARARRLIRELEALRSDPAARARMWAAEYQSMKATAIHAFESGFAGTDAIEGIGGLRRMAVRLAPNSFIFHPNRTFAELAESFRALQGDSARVCSEISAARELATRYEYEGWRQLVAPNGIGRLYMALSAPDYRGFEQRRCAGETRISLLQTRLAVEAYRAEEGKLPETLGALVPNYFDVLPVDGFDGKKLRFSGTRGELWSTGDESLTATF